MYRFFRNKYHCQPRMIKLFLFTTLIFAAVELGAQQCGYSNYYLFVVHPHFPNSSEKTPNLNMYLVDENEKPVLASVTYREDKEWKKRSDTLFFWDMAKFKKNNEFGPPLFRIKYYRIGKDYVVAFRLDMPQLQNPLQYPIYKLKIEGIPGRNNKTYSTQVVHLPIQKAVRICNNGILEDFNFANPVTTLDGQVFEPIDITLNQNSQPNSKNTEEQNGLQYAVRFEYTAANKHSGEVTTYHISAARIFNVNTGQLHQEIYIPAKSTSVVKEIKNIVEFEDFYGRNIKEARDFSVLMETWRDLQFKVKKEQTNFYLYNAPVKKYELDTALSNYTDVFFYRPLKKMRRYEYVKTNRSDIRYTYQLAGKKWVLVDKEETLFTPVPPPIEYGSKTCVLFKDQLHSFPLQAVLGTNAVKHIKDTFWLYNACNDTVFIKKAESHTGSNFFSIIQALPPKQNTPLIFNGKIYNSGNDFITNNFGCQLTFADGHTMFFSIEIPTISNNCRVFYKSDSTINYAIAQPHNSRFTNAILTYPNGYVRAIGKVLDDDTALKLGNWQYYAEGVRGTNEITYSKAISLNAFDEITTGLHTNFNIKVLEHGQWQQPYTEPGYNGKKMYITDKTDSIVAYTDSSSYGFNLQYSKMGNDNSIQFFLLKPNQRSLKIGNYTTPFNTIKDTYTIIPNYSVIKSPNKTTYQVTNDIITALQKKYRKKKQVVVGRNQTGIELADYTQKEKIEILQTLQKDNAINFVCQLFTTGYAQRSGFCDNRVYAEIDINTSEDFKKEALQLGFADVQNNMGNNRYWLIYKSKIVNEEFFKAFEQLTKHRLVKGAYFNTYSEAEPDNNVNGN